MRRRPTLLATTAVLVLASLGIGIGGLAATLRAVTLATPPPSLATVTSRPTSTPAPTLAPDPTIRPSSAYVPSDLEQRGVRERLQAALDAARDQLAAPGIMASVLFADGTQWTGMAGVADLATDRGLDADTPFAVASISKTFLAAEIMALAGEGRLDLDDAVVLRLPDVPVGGRPIDARITIRQLLNHTSGLGDFLVSRQLDAAVRADPATAWTPAMSLAYAVRPAGAPGEGYHYANTNYVLLGLIVERLTERPLAEEYRDRFFEPFGLASAFYQGVDAPTGELPTAYRYSSSRLDARPVDVTDGTAIRPFTAITTAAGAAGSVAMSARDLARWGRILFDGHALSSDAVSVMVGDAISTAALDPGYPYGLGVQVVVVDGRVTYGHSGRLVGARSVLRWFPEGGIAIAVVTNESRFDPTSVVRAMIDIVAPERFGTGGRPE